MDILEYKDYRKSLLELRRRGGPFQKAAEKAIVIQDDLADEQRRNKLPVTNNGENRIQKAVKYDLGYNNCRLVTIQDGGRIFVCFVGIHDDVDCWLEKNRGLKIRTDGERRAVPTFESEDHTQPDKRLKRKMGFTDKPLISMLAKSQQDQLLSQLNTSVAESIANAKVYISDDEILKLVDDIQDKRHKLAVFDVLMMLRGEDVDGASKRVFAYTGELNEIADETHESSPLVDSAYFQHINVDSETYKKLIENFALHADYKDWMLFMHPDQQRFVDADYPGPTKLTGVSGSGKTAVVVRRAIRLAERYPGAKTLVLTLNRSLAVLIRELVTAAAIPSVSGRVEVLPFFALCQRLLHKFEPQNTRLYDDVTWKTKEHIDEIWREYYRCELNNYDARVLQDIHDSLIARGIDAESYIREEMDWIRSATAPDERDAYLEMDRMGRTYPLDKTMRGKMLEGLDGWERKMRFVGVTDYLGIANALHRHFERIKPAYKCVLVDESQDFGTIDFRLIRSMVPEGENDIFLCGDAAQKVSSKHRSLSEAGVPVPGARSSRLVLNYRNSRQILEVAHGMLMDNVSDEMLNTGDFEILDPKYANFGGPSPLLLTAENLGIELAMALAYAKQEAADNSAIKICIAICGYTEHELHSFARQLGLPILNGETNLKAEQIILSDLENTKGFEFQCMIIVNCNKGTIPNPRAPEGEEFRDLSRLYVAMTRARHQLILSCSGEPSLFLQKQLGNLGQYAWTEYVEPQTPIEPPRHLALLREDVVHRDIGNLTGEEYLYEEHAIGCPSLLVEKLRRLVSGRNYIVQGSQVEWRTIAEAAKSTKDHPRSRQAFGPEGYRLFRERFGSYHSDVNLQKKK